MIRDHSVRSATRGTPPPRTSPIEDLAALLHSKFRLPATDLLLVTVLLALTLLLFFKSLSTYFVGDDFFWLQNARDTMSTGAGWSSALLHLNGSGQYRPLTLNIFFWLGSILFGFHPLPFHLMLLCAFLVTVVAVYAICRRSGLSSNAAFLGAALFAFSNTHYEGIAWVDAFTETGASCLFALGLYYTVANKRLGAIAFYSLCLLANETAIVLPAIAALYLLLVEGTSLVSSIKRTAGLWVILTVYAIGRVGILGIRATGPFRASYSPLTWLRLVATTVKQGAGLTPTFLNGYIDRGPWHIAALVFIGLLIIALILVAVRLVRVFTAGRWRIVAFGAASFIIGLLPVLPFSYNWAQYNMSIGLIGASILLGGLVNVIPSKALITPLLAPALFGINFIAIYNPGGNNAVDGVRSLAIMSHAVVSDIRRAVALQPRGVRVDIVGDFAPFNGTDGVTWALNPVALQQLFDPHGSVSIAPTAPRKQVLVIHLGASGIDVVRN